MSFNTQALNPFEYTHDQKNNKGAYRKAAIWGADSENPKETSRKLYYLDKDGNEQELNSVDVSGPENVYYVEINNGEYVATENGTSFPITPYYKLDNSNDPVSYAIYDLDVKNKIVGTNPIEGTYRSAAQFKPLTQVSVDNVQGLGEELEIRAVSLTLSEAKASDLSIGQKVFLTDYDNALYQVVDDSETGGYYIDNILNNKKLSFVFNSKFNALHFGIKSSLPDNTLIFNAMCDYLPDNSSVFWPISDQPYIGNFVTSKAISFYSDGAVLVNLLNDEKILSIDAFEDNVTEYAVSESELINGNTTFTVTNASTIFDVGDIGYLWDGALQPGTTSRVNFECIRIYELSGDTVTVEGIIHSHKGAGKIKFYHSTKQNKDISVSGLIINPTSSHTAQALFIQGCQKVNVENYESNGFTGSAARMDFCYDVTTKKIRPLNPAKTGSGQGYGVELRGVTTYTGKNIKGVGCRHVYDADSIYQWDLSDVVDMEDKSAPVNISHTGFCAYGTVDGVIVKTTQYPITGNDTGYGADAGQALRRNHPMRQVTIKNVKSTVDESKTPNDSNVSGVYIRSNVDGVNIDNINVKHANFTIPTGVNNNNVVRIEGIAIGQLSITNISVDGCGRVVFSTGESDTLQAANEISVFNDLYAAYAYEPIRLQGSWRPAIDNLGFGSVGGGKIIRLEDLSGMPTLGAYIGENIHYSGNDIVIFEQVNGSFLTQGKFNGLSKSIGSSVNLVTNYQITQEDIQNRAECLSLIPPDANPITINALPQPLVNGQRLSLYNTVGSTRGVITISAGTYNSEITLPDDDLVTELVARSNFWRPVNR